MEDQIKQLKQMMQVIIEDDNFFELKAKMSRKMFNALKTEGFSDEQATEICANNSQQ
jgi:hypothetical protein